MTEFIMELNSTNELFGILNDLKKKNIINGVDFRYYYEHSYYEHSNHMSDNKINPLNENDYRVKKIVKFYFVDPIYATYLKLLYT